MFIDTVPKPMSGTKSASKLSPLGPLAGAGGAEQSFVFNVKRLVIAAILLVVILLFVIGTAFFNELSQVHTMLVHAFELVLGIVAGLLGGEAIAKAQKS